MSDRRVVAYQLITDDHLDRLADRVNDLLPTWQPYLLFTHANYWIQAMVRYEDVPVQKAQWPMCTNCGQPIYANHSCVGVLP